MKFFRKSIIRINRNQRIIHLTPLPLRQRMKILTLIPDLNHLGMKNKAI